MEGVQDDGGVRLPRVSYVGGPTAAYSLHKTQDPARAPAALLPVDGVPGAPTEIGTPTGGDR